MGLSQQTIATSHALEINTPLAAFRVKATNVYQTVYVTIQVVNMRSGALVQTKHGRLANASNTANLETQHHPGMSWCPAAAPNIAVPPMAAHAATTIQKYSMSAQQVS